MLNYNLTPERIDYLNIGLMIVSVIFAFIFPFELFLFSYAILGPLHYLTEIGWLHKKNYFTTGKKDYLILVLIGFMITLGFLINKFQHTEPLNPLINNPVSKLINSYFPLFFFLAFASGIAVVFFTKLIHKISIIAIAIIAGILLKDVRIYILFFVLLVPTIIHVWVFTGIFILSGAIKNNLFSGHLSFIVFLFCSFLFFIFPSQSIFQVSDYVKNSFSQSDFIGLNSVLNHLIFQTKKGVMLDSSRGLMVQRFIAFAYTYHYLNWFSKTKIIRWHEVPKGWIWITFSLWIISIGLYTYSYNIGFIALFFLSILHVYLELPLNFKTISMLKGKRMEKVARSSK